MTKNGSPSSVVPEQARDVGMVQSRQDLPLAAKARDHGRAVHTAPDDLERRLLLEGFIVTDRAVDSPHAAVADHGSEAPDAEALANQFLARDRQIGSLVGDCGLNGGQVTTVCGSQGFDLQASAPSRPLACSRRSGRSSAGASIMASTTSSIRFHCSEFIAPRPPIGLRRYSGTKPLTLFLRQLAIEPRLGQAHIAADRRN